METTTYTTSHGSAPVQVVPVTVTEERPQKGNGCLSGLGGLMILLGLAIIAIEAACIGLYLYLESSAVGIYVGFFAIITGVVCLVAGGRRSGRTPSKLLAIIVTVMAVICAMKAFALFATSAALLAYAVTSYYQLQNRYPQYSGFGGSTFLGGVNTFLGGSSYYGGMNYYNRIALEMMIGLKATAMVLYLILLIVSLIASALGCLNCCRKRSKRHSKVVMTTVYPNGRKSAVVQHKV